MVRHRRELPHGRRWRDPAPRDRDWPDGRPLEGSAAQFPRCTAGRQVLYLAIDGVRRCRAPPMDWHILWEYRAALWSGLVVTVWISAAGIVGSTVVGVVIGCLGSTPSFYLRKLTSAYTELLRNLPLLVKVFFFYFVLSMPTIPAAL